MDDDDLFPSRDRRSVDPSDAVRIIGAEEAETAFEREDVAHRLPDDVPKFGDRPKGPTFDGPRPVIRFPLSATSQPEEIERAPIVPAEPVEMPHWTAPPTGEVPRVLASADGDDDDLSAWSNLGGGQPRWQGEGSLFGDDGFDDFGALGDDDTRIGALDTEAPDPDAFFTFDEEPSSYDAGGYDEGAYYDDEGYEYDEQPPVATRSASRGRPPARAAARTAGAGYERPQGAGRDLQAATIVGVGLLVGFMALAKFAGAKGVMVAVVAILGLAAAEFFTVLRKAGYQSATMLGVAAVPALALGAYWKGAAAYPVLVALTIVFSLVWYLVGAGEEGDAPVMGAATTAMGALYIGGLGSFAALILQLPGEMGVGVLWGAILATVGYDVGGYFIGRSFGSRPLSAASPNKTVEGLLGGWLGAIVLGGFVSGFLISPWSEADVSITTKLAFGLAAALAATLGDLCESMMKRDFGVKDMGTLLPGHGGVLDRFDAMLFVLPATYFVAITLLL